MAELIAERGAGPWAVPIEEAIARAGVSPERLGERFADREACALAAFDLGVHRAQARIVPAYEAQSRWLDAIKAALAAFLEFLEAEPALGRLCVIHAMGGGADLLRRRAEVLEALAGALDRGRPAAPLESQEPPPVIAEGVIGAVLSVLQSRLLEQERPALQELFGALTSIIVLPYLGASVARRELRRPAPRTRAREETAPAGAGLTYRRTRVLSAIADYPGASNREVAERAGVVDQGQISKLLGRLEAAELVCKLDGERTRGAPNSWSLTVLGERALGRTPRER
jgi:DNA-binding MarR family transcriptional regulator